MSIRSGRLGEMPQPESGLAPDISTGEPGIVPPERFQPSSEATLASYQEERPPRGPCGLIRRRVAPSAERVGANAMATARWRDRSPVNLVLPPAMSARS